MLRTPLRRLNLGHRSPQRFLSPHAAYAVFGGFEPRRTNPMQPTDRAVASGSTGTGRRSCLAERPVPRGSHAGEGRHRAWAGLPAERSRAWEPRTRQTARTLSPADTATGKPSDGPRTRQPEGQSFSRSGSQLAPSHANRASNAMAANKTAPRPAKRMSVPGDPEANSTDRILETGVRCQSERRCCVGHSAVRILESGARNAT